MSTVLSIATILSSFAVVMLGFCMPEGSALSSFVLAFGIIGAGTAVGALILTKREMARMRAFAIANFAAHTVFGGE